MKGEVINFKDKMMLIVEKLTALLRSRYCTIRMLFVVSVAVFSIQKIIDPGKKMALLT